MTEKTVHTVVIELVRSDAADNAAMKSVQQDVFSAVDNAVRHEGLAVEATGMRTKTVAENPGQNNTGA